MTIKTGSGATAEINLASFRESIGLKNTIVAELSKVGIDFKLSADLDIEAILPAILKVDSSEEVEKAIFQCLARCTYEGEKITQSTFEAEAARGDYYEIVIECLKVNLSPFFSGLLSKLEKSGLLKKA